MSRWQASHMLHEWRQSCSLVPFAPHHRGRGSRQRTGRIRHTEVALVDRRDAGAVAPDIRPVGRGLLELIVAELRQRRRRRGFVRRIRAERAQPGRTTATAASAAVGCSAALSVAAPPLQQPAAVAAAAASTHRASEGLKESCSLRRSSRSSACSFRCCRTSSASAGCCSECSHPTQARRRARTHARAASHDLRRRPRAPRAGQPSLCGVGQKLRGQGAWGAGRRSRGPASGRPARSRSAGRSARWRSTAGRSG